MNLDNQNLVVIVGALFAVSEALSLIPAIKSNGVFQLIVSVLGQVVKKKA